MHGAKQGEWVQLLLKYTCTNVSQVRFHFWICWQLCCWVRLIAPDESGQYHWTIIIFTNVYNFQARGKQASLQSSDIETEFLRNSVTSMDFHTNEHKYRLDFKTFKQKNMNPKYGTERQIRRRPIFQTTGIPSISPEYVENVHIYHDRPEMQILHYINEFSFLIAYFVEIK